MLRYITEFRDASACRALIAQIGESRGAADQLSFMEFCGGHTHAILRSGLRQALPPWIRMLSGPGCPVCVTAQGDIDTAIGLVEQHGVALATFGDMMRVPGSGGSLQEARARGADVRVVYSVLDALKMAESEPAREVVFLGVGFETTAPGTAAAAQQARARGVGNFSLLCLHKLTPPAMRAIVEAGEVKLDGVLGPGHVTTVIGAEAWGFLPREHGLGCAISGFEPVDLLLAVSELVRMAMSGKPVVANTYQRSATAAGNANAKRLLEQVFEPATVPWRGLGSVPASGLVLRPEFASLDARVRFPLTLPPAREPAGCRCGEVLRGVLAPTDCPLFGGACTPESPFGPCMVSSEGTCAAYYQFGADCE